jgi:hypothetical protein
MCPRRCSNPCPWVLSFFMFMFTFLFLFPSVSFYISNSPSVSFPPFLPLFFHLSLSRSLSSARSPPILRFSVFPLCLFPPVSFPRIFPLSLSHRPSMSLQCLSPSVSPLPLSFRLSFFYIHKKLYKFCLQKKHEIPQDSCKSTVLYSAELKSLQYRILSSV